MKTIHSIAAFALVAATASVHAAGPRKSPPEVVSSVEIARYDGLWFEQRRIPNNFQDNRPQGRDVCRSTVAEYGQLPSGRVSVRNTCYRQGPSGVESEIAEAVARVVEGSEGAKLKVNFTGIEVLRWLGIGDGDYWVLALGPLDAAGDYSWALVGSPSREYGWILSRQQRLPNGEIEAILDIAEAQGYSRASFGDFR